ncbi:L,D-transpeptidase family protein [Novosphingobium cyanobacteriorum]|uniref:L,D-transpeptidase family protein n=1 Tax=Novosphingobium cyanobacteriorum TaxID=3024215 RepID=A0ABT6CHZ3_9SPHN|nr:L,D-transpeptidase family protein [Novosphingobium cyanobacteriorum]MDF8333536.1 L,D-transpeptidase family protein [Novosphingobium cyanobacteriorum]
MHRTCRIAFHGTVAAVALAAVLAGGQAGARAAQRQGPVDLTAQAAPAKPAPAPATAAAKAAPAAAVPTEAPETPTSLADLPPPPPPLAHWTLADAKALLAAIRGIGADGLFARDYEPAALTAAIAKGEGDELDQLASRLFVWLAQDIRDGRTPMTARVQWFAVDPDQDIHPDAALLAQATETHDVAGVLESLKPTHPDYAQLKDMLTKTKDPKQIGMIRANMDRWRWLGRDLGLQYLMINVPEQELRLTVNNKIIRTYRAIVGKPGKTATPQLAEQVKNVVFNPTWTVPQSIVVGEGLGARLLASPARAKREGYVATKNADGTITVVQQPGENNSLGRVKLDMPNEHAIYIHDTPNRNLFALPARALSHGCIRAERATELAMTMAILGADLPPDTAVEYNLSGKYTKVPMTKPWAVYITYFTVARDVNGLMRSFGDIYNRDAPVIASFAKPRELHTSQRKSNEAIIKLDNPL